MLDLAQAEASGDPIGTYESLIEHNLPPQRFGSCSAPSAKNKGCSAYPYCRFREYRDRINGRIGPGNIGVNVITPHGAADGKIMACFMFYKSGLDATRKQKWLEVATRYPQLSPEGKKHVHERMAEIVQLTPEQRRVMRENFKRAYELPPEQRELRVQGFQQLPEERRRELAESAKPAAPAKVEPPRKPTRELLAPADPARPAQ